MKLAEALALRSDAQRRLEQLRTRAIAVARYQEGEPPVEDAAVLHRDAQAVIIEIEELVRKINRTNSVTEIEPGVTITDAIARRDALATRHKLTVSVADAASGGSRSEYGFGRQLRSELRYVTDLDVPALRTEADQIAREHRELDTRLQQANWATELVD